MPTYAEITCQLLTDAAAFFIKLGDENEPLKEQMEENAKVFEQVAALLAQDPTGSVEDKTNAELAGRLLVDASKFFRTLAEQNEHIKDQMMENADIYEQFGNNVMENPTGDVPTQ